METLFSQFLLSALGWVYLKIKYRRNSNVRAVLAKEYNGNYYDAGAYISMKTFGIIFLSLIALMIVVAIFSIFKFGFE